MFQQTFLGLWLLSTAVVHAQADGPPTPGTANGRPALIATDELAGFDSLPADRRKLIAESIAVAKNASWLRYTARGARPSDGGFDCSGAMYYVMRLVGLDPPRISADQYNWLKQNNRLHLVPEDAPDLDHPSLKNLHPGDLLFWGRRTEVSKGTKMQITHVAMFLGTEKKDSHPVMINSTDGRSYRGTKANGYGVYDFKLPSAGAKVAFLGYGTPPGIAQVESARPD